MAFALVDYGPLQEVWPTPERLEACCCYSLSLSRLALFCPPLQTDKAGRETALLGTTGRPVAVSADWTVSGKYAHGRVTVQMDRAESVRLFADPAASVAGAVECKACSRTLALPRSITLRRVDVTVADWQELKVAADGSIAAADIPAGQYSLELTRPRDGLYIATLEMGGKAVDDRVLRVGESQSAVIQLFLGLTSSSSTV